MKNTVTTFLFLLLFAFVTFAQETKQETTAEVNTTSGIENTTATTYDFTTGSDKYYGGTNGATEVQAGVWGMIAGDGDGNGGINIDDRNLVWRVENGTIGYKSGDYDLNGGVNIDDRNLYWRINNGKLSQVP